MIQSTGPFTASDVTAICRLGEPAWLLDATLFHDSFAEEGRRAFSDLPYLAPDGFPKLSAVDTSPLVPAPAEWVGELDVLPLAGMPKCREHLFIHRPSRTLIVCDCLFNFGKMPSKWTRFFLRNVMRLRDGIGMSAFFRFLIRDRAAFKESVRPILEWDFQRMIVGHGGIIEADAKRVFREALEARNLLPAPEAV